MISGERVSETKGQSGKAKLLKDISDAQALSRLNEEELVFLLKAYFSGALERWDKEDKLPPAMSIRIRAFLSKTTGRSLMEQASHEQLAAIVAELESVDVQIGGVTYPGWHIYALRVHTGFESPFAEVNEEKPVPTAGQIKRAFTAYARLVHDKILNQKR